VRWFIAYFTAVALFGRAEAQDGPRELLRRAAEAMGGERLTSLAAVRLSGIGYSNALEQSERPEGPWLKVFEQFTELRDLRGSRVRRSARSRSGPWSADWGPALVMVADSGVAVWERGGRWLLGRSADRDAAIEALRFGPERVLATAAAAPDLRLLTDTTVGGVRNRRLSFRYGSLTAELLIDAHTFLPAGYQLRGPSSRAFDWVWGDVTRAVWYSLWSFDPPGIRYPRMILEELNGQPLREAVLTGVEFDPAAPADSFPLTDSLRIAFATMAARAPDLRTVPLGRSFRGEPLAPIEAAPGVTVFPGPWYVALVRQPDGVVVVEAPISPAYSAQVLAEAARRYPGVPVKAVVSTSDAWPHFSGIREYVARGVPIHHLDLNRPILERFVSARWGATPDSLERARRSPLWRPVTGRSSIGDGANRLEVIPVRGEGGERMMVVWLPAHHLLYASDLVQRQPDGTFFWPEYLLEVVEVVRREGLDVERVWAMHADPLPWRDVVAAVEAVRRSGAP
jgi:hypothetical protein